MKGAIFKRPPKGEIFLVNFPNNYMKKIMHQGSPYIDAFNPNENSTANTHDMLIQQGQILKAHTIAILVRQPNNIHKKLEGMVPC